MDIIISTLYQLYHAWIDFYCACELQEDLGATIDHLLSDREWGRADLTHKGVIPQKVPDTLLSENAYSAFLSFVLTFSHGVQKKVAASPDAMVFE